ncbi:hypothetical protein C4D60_Mb06t22810 [Musa balbisiana]|uniref:Uncharacterized protein n=1 Tax=Musa balbisiana TaxID=52838 RepID=A0A4V4H439_MUSBA|nr:hypothetical protein C4D60_Mb06t22810 [Musa balbisiana]
MSASRRKASFRFGSYIGSSLDKFAGAQGSWYYPGAKNPGETNRAPFDLPEAEAESVAGYNVEYARDAILSSSLLVEANVPGTHSDFNKGWVFTNFQIPDFGIPKKNGHS